MLRKCKHYKHCLLFKNYNLCVGRINRQSFSNLYKHFVIKIRKLSIILMARNKVENCLHVTRLSIIYLLNTRWHGVWAWCRKAVIHFFFFYLRDFQYTYVLTCILCKLFWNCLRGPEDARYTLRLGVLEGNTYSSTTIWYFTVKMLYKSRLWLDFKMHCTVPCCSSWMDFFDIYQTHHHIIKW